jgi:DNA polymerase-4
MRTAVKLCPELVIIPANHDRYREASQKVMEKLSNLTPMVEQISIDEAFLDVTMRPELASQIAGMLQKQINSELKLAVSLGVATNKLIAKIANNRGKSRVRTDTYPNHIEIVRPGKEAEYLVPLPIRELWGVGAKTAEKLNDIGIQTIGDITRLSEKELIRRFGKNGGDIYRHARGIDDRPVENEGEAKSISKEITFDTDVVDFEILQKVLRQLSDGVGRQVRRNELVGTTIKLKLRWSDFTTLTRQITLEYTTDQDDEIFRHALILLKENWHGRRVRLIGVGMSNFEEPHRQLGLWENTEVLQEQKRLQSTLDELRDRFGDGSIKRGSDLK